MHRVHIFGASGSGTTSIARALAKETGYRHWDTDDFYWQNTPIPFEEARPEEERVALLSEALAKREEWILSGSLCGWGDVFIPQFTLAVFVYTPAEVRLARLRRRESARYGDRIKPGGDLEEKSRAFLTWAAGYDSDTGMDSRNLARHRKWIEGLPCPVLELDGGKALADSVASIFSLAAGNFRV